jgi:hypothetical protein
MDPEDASPPPGTDNSELESRVPVEAASDIIIRELQGVPIPFASPRLLWRMKVHTHREKDRADLLFLREYFAARGETPPEC